MIIKVESYKIFSEIYCPIMPAPLELFFGDGCRSEQLLWAILYEQPSQQCKIDLSTTTKIPEFFYLYDSLEICKKEM